MQGQQGGGVAALVRRLAPRAHIVAGGYDPSLAPEAYEPATAFDTLVRGEGEHTLRALLRALEHDADLAAIPGLSHRRAGALVHNPHRPVVRLATEPLALPARKARVLGGYTLLGRAVDVVETSRGCTFDCSFCYDLDYVVQAMTAPLAEHGATLAPLMRRDDLAFLNVSAKNARRERGRTVGNASVTAIEHLHRHGLYVVGGLIVGSPGDTRASIEANLAFARRYVDWPYIQHPTPYPRTPMTAEFRRRGLIVDDDVAHYDGTTAVVRTEHVPADEVEFLRWRAERWMKVRHLPAALRHSPRFVLRHGLAMLRHTFAGTTLRSLMGMADEQDTFGRFRAIRRRERERRARLMAWTASQC